MHTKLTPSVGETKPFCCSHLIMSCTVMTPNTSCRVKAEKVACSYSLVLVFVFSHLVEESLENYSVIGNHHPSLVHSYLLQHSYQKLMPFIL